MGDQKSSFSWLDRNFQCFSAPSGERKQVSGYSCYNATTLQIIVINMTFADLIMCLCYMLTRPYLSLFPNIACHPYYVTIWTIQLVSCVNLVWWVDTYWYYMRILTMKSVETHFEDFQSYRFRLLLFNSSITHYRTWFFHLFRIPLTFSLLHHSSQNIFRLNVDKLIFIQFPLHYYSIINRRKILILSTITWIVLGYISITVDSFMSIVVRFSPLPSPYLLLTNKLFHFREDVTEFKSILTSTCPSAFCMQL